MPIENEQPATGQSFYYLEICCRLVAEKFGKLPITSWTNSDYMRLSSILLRHTAVTLSASTLKRIFGKLKTPERYYPQKATRDALAVYAGYFNWDDLIKHHRQREESSQPPRANEPVAPVATSRVLPEMATALSAKKNWIQYRRKGLLLIVPVLAIASVLVLFRFAGRPSGWHGAGKIEFRCINPEGLNPHTANFSLKLQNEPDEMRQLYVDFGDGRKIEAVAGRRAFSHYYETPGRYFCVLKYDQEPVDTAIVYLKTNGWVATGDMPRDTTRVYPIEVNLPSVKSQALGASIPQIFHAGIDTNNTFFVHFDNITPTKIDGDNFEFAADVITSAQRPGVRCSQLNIIVYGERSKHAFCVIRPGCEQWLGLQLSERSGKSIAPDLSFLDADLSKGGRVKLNVSNKKAAIYINDRCVFTGNYMSPLKNIYGVSVKFSGVGSIHSFYLRDNQTKELFPGSFN